MTNFQNRNRVRRASYHLVCFAQRLRQVIFKLHLSKLIINSKIQTWIRAQKLVNPILVFLHNRKFWTFMLWSAIYSSFLLLILVPESSPYLCLHRALKQGSNLLLGAHRSCWGSTVLPLVPCLVLPKWGHLESKPPWNVGDSDKRPDRDCERALLWFSFSL